MTSERFYFNWRRVEIPNTFCAVDRGHFEFTLQRIEEKYEEDKDRDDIMLTVPSFVREEVVKQVVHTCELFFSKAIYTNLPEVGWLIGITV